MKFAYLFLCKTIDTSIMVSVQIKFTNKTLFRSIIPILFLNTKNSESSTRVALTKLTQKFFCAVWESFCLVVFKTPRLIVLIPFTYRRKNVRRANKKSDNRPDIQGSSGKLFSCITRGRNCKFLMLRYRSITIFIQNRRKNHSRKLRWLRSIKLKNV